jgi:hypothetical protein
MLVVYGLLGRKVKSVGQRPLPSRQKIIHDVSNIFNINQSINQTSKEIRGAVVVVIVWWLDFQLPVPVQSVPITTNVVSSKFQLTIKSVHLYFIPYHALYSISTSNNLMTYLFWSPTKTIDFFR